MKPIGNIPSPYGVSVAVFFDGSKNPNKDDCYFNDIEGCLTLAGIHDPKSRAACKAELEKQHASGSISAEVFFRHGGRKSPVVSLKKPADPAYPRIAKICAQLPTESWVTLALDHAGWSTRADALLNIIGSNMEVSETWSVPQEVPAMALSQMLTAALEHLVEPEIDCLEAAAIYALTEHDSEWVGPAVEWLTPFRETWFRDWIEKRPSYTRFATVMRKVNPDLPRWIAGEKRSAS